MIDIFTHGAVRELRMARPPANALDHAFIRALKDAVEAAPDDGARALVLSGRAGMFSAGLDVPALLQLDRPAMVALWVDFFGLMESMARSPIPLAAAVTGHATAGGAVLALFCDYRVMADGDFKLGLNEVRVGLPLPPVIFAALAYTVGRRFAQQLGVSGALIHPAEALRVGFVDAVVAPDQTIPRAIAWCDEMIALPPAAMATTRHMARAPVGDAFDALDPAGIEAFVNVWFSDETQTTLRGLAARLGKG